MIVLYLPYILVLREKWGISSSNSELQEFLRVTNSRLKGQKKTSGSKSRTPPSSGVGETQDDAISDGNGLQSPFERIYSSPVDALICLVREKFHLLAPTVDVSVGIRTIQLHIVDRSFGDRRARTNTTDTSKLSLQGTGPSLSETNVSTMSTTFIIHGTALHIHQQSILFSALPENVDVAVEQKIHEGSPRRFQDIALTVDGAHWKPDVAVLGDLSLPTFLDQSPCGLLYKISHDATDPVLSFALDHRKESNKALASHLQIKVTAGHSIFLINSIPLASSLSVLMSFADLPLRDLASEKEAQELAELENSAEDNASSRQLTQFSFSAAQSDEFVDTAAPKGIFLGGANISLTAQISNVVFVPLSDESGVVKTTLETTIEDISIIAESSEDGCERAEVSISPFMAQQCKLLHALGAKGGLVRLFHHPFKPALAFGGASVSYSATLNEGGGPAMSTRTGTYADQESHIFDIYMAAYIRRIEMNISPMINVSFLGALNCCNIVVANLPTPEEPSPDLRSSLSRDGEGYRREALKELWMLADRDGSGTLSVDEVAEIIARLFSANSLNIFDEMPKSQQLTDEELKREVGYFLSVAGSSSTATRDLTFPEVEMALFQKQRLVDGGVDGINDSEHAVQGHDFGLSERLRGLIYYDDLREYASPSQVYRMTGVNDSRIFPPPSSWRQEKGTNSGVSSFWELYERETGCTKASLNGQVSGAQSLF